MVRKAEMKVKDLIKKLFDDGWVKKGKVTVPVHGGDIPKGTLNAILKQTGLK